MSQATNEQPSMGRTQQVLTTILWAALVVVMLCFLIMRLKPGVTTPAPASVIRTDAALPMLFPAASFALVDENGKPFSDADLRGHVWVCDFVFTHCAGPCPMMTARLAEFQKRVPDPSVHMVSFSVDPERDTPEVLKEYAAKFKADPRRWHFLTGETSKIFDVAAGMKLTAKPADPENEILHDERFLLVDQQGQVRGIYHSKDADSMQKLARDAAALASAGAGAP